MMFVCRALEADASLPKRERRFPPPTIFRVWCNQRGRALSSGGWCYNADDQIFEGDTREEAEEYINKYLVVECGFLRCWYEIREVPA